MAIASLHAAEISFRIESVETDETLTHDGGGGCVWLPDGLAGLRFSPQRVCAAAATRIHPPLSELRPARRAALVFRVWRQRSPRAASGNGAGSRCQFTGLALLRFLSRHGGFLLEGGGNGDRFPSRRGRLSEVLELASAHDLARCRRAGAYRCHIFSEMAAERGDGCPPGAFSQAVPGRCSPLLLSCDPASGRGILTQSKPISRAGGNSRMGLLLSVRVYHRRAHRFHPLSLRLARLATSAGRGARDISRRRDPRGIVLPRHSAEPARNSLGAPRRARPGRGFIR